MTYMYVQCACQGWKSDVRTAEDILLLFVQAQHTVPSRNIHVHVQMLHISSHGQLTGFVGGSPIALVILYPVIIATEHCAKLTNIYTEVTLRVQSRYGMRRMLLPNSDVHIKMPQGVAQGIGAMENKGTEPMGWNNTFSSTSGFDLANMISNQ